MRLTFRTDDGESATITVPPGTNIWIEQSDPDCSGNRRQQPQGAHRPGDAPGLQPDRVRRTHTATAADHTGPAAQVPPLLRLTTQPTDIPERGMTMRTKNITYTETITHTVRVDLPDDADETTVRDIVTSGAVDSLEYVAEDFEVLASDDDTPA